MQCAPVTRSLRNVPIAQDSSINDQTRFTMRRRSYRLRSCVRSGFQHVLLLGLISYGSPETAHADFDVPYQIPTREYI